METTSFVLHLCSQKYSFGIVAGINIFIFFNFVIPLNLSIALSEYTSKSRNDITRFKVSKYISNCENNSSYLADER